MSSWSASTAELNARLLLALKEALSAAEVGSIAGFFEVEASWRCPCCYRTKSEIARLDKNGNLLCAIVSHHDHFPECVSTRIDSRAFEHGVVSAVESSFERFSPTFICQDCNVAEPAAKAAVDARKPFSFAPHEIAGFIKVTPNAPHEIDHGQALAIYEALLPSMRLLGDRLRGIGRSEDGSDWQPVARSAWRVLKDARKKMKDAAE